MVRVLHHLNDEAATALAAEFPAVEFVSIPREGTLDPDGHNVEAVCHRPE